MILSFRIRLEKKNFFFHSRTYLTQIIIYLFSEKYEKDTVKYYILFLEKKSYRIVKLNEKFI
tara:strand:+ start:287 stop:472 length:186 start_codon:yes stop_codon:yes gene_type:complete